MGKSSSESGVRRSTATKKTSLAASVAIVVLVVGYVLLRPLVESKFGIQLPRVLQDQTERETPPLNHAQEDAQRQASDDRNASRQDKDDAAGTAGNLRDVGRGVLVSPAGLRYTRGSLEGHRLKHVMRHAEDQPDRPGSHGVFEGDQETVLALIDEAYLLAKKDSRRAQLREEDGRQIYTVNMQRQIGYIGGQSGRRMNHPPARHVRLVLEGDRVISAYPVKQ